MMKCRPEVDPSYIGRVPIHVQGYPIVCHVEVSNRFRCIEAVCCPCCTNKAAWNPPLEDGDTLTLIGFGVFWSGSPIECAMCVEKIESAYGSNLHTPIGTAMELRG